MPSRGSKVAAVPPCHPLLNFVQNNEHEIVLHIASRSQDLIVGFPGDLVRYALLLHVIVEIVNSHLQKSHYTAKALDFNFQDLHVYADHKERFMQNENVWRDKPFTEKLSTPVLFANLTNSVTNSWLTPEMFALEGYKTTQPKIRYGLIV
jgi:thymidylate synthase